MSNTSMISGDNIHVKLQFNSEYRRFFFQRSAKFSELKDKIKVVLGLNEDFVVKYKDEEGEWITISSDMELETGLIISNGSIFRLQIVIANQTKGKETEKVETEDEGCGKHWKKWRKWRKWDNEENDGECGEKEENFCPRRSRGRGRGCRGKWKKWREWKDEKNENEEPKEQKGEENDTGDGKSWKRMKREKRRMKKMEDDGESSSENLSGDSLLSLEEIKVNLEKLKKDLEVLKEKSQAAKSEVKEIKIKLKEKRKNESSDIDGIVALSNTLKEKKQSWFTIFKELKLTRHRIKKLHDIAENKTV